MNLTTKLINPFSFFETRKKKKKNKIGFVIEQPLSYNQVMASTRLRVYDVLNEVKEENLELEIYQSNKNYDLVIFQKCFLDNHVQLAQELKKRGTIVILDINIDVVTLDGVVAIFDFKQQSNLKAQQSSILKMLTLVDYVITASPQLQSVYSNYHPNVFTIEEMVTSNFFHVQKKHKIQKKVFLTYCGYQIKAKELLQIKPVLKALHKDFGVELLYIADAKPKLDIIPSQFIPYNQKKLPKLLTKGDIKIAPRDLRNSYNLGHSFTKPAYPMAVGLPVVASPVPSYLNREVLICKTDSEWYRTLKSLIKQVELRTYFGEKGRNFVKANFNEEKIKSDYINFFKMILN